MKEKKKTINGFIISGIILIILQLLSYKGNYSANNSLTYAIGLDQLNTPYGIFFVLGTNIFIIIGIILLIIGIKKLKKK